MNISLSKKTVRGKGELNIDRKSIIIFCILPFVCSVIFRLLNLTDEINMKTIMRLALMTEAVYAGFSAYKKQLTVQRILFLIIVAGCILRIGYTLYTPPYTRSHDMGANDFSGNGHWGYVYNLVNGHLPQDNSNQFYHPPIYYIVSAFMIKFTMVVTGITDMTQVDYIPQLVSCACSLVVLITLTKLMDELNINKWVQIIPLTLTALYPEQIMTAGRFNNDSMAQMFTVLALYYTALWHKENKLSHIVGIAVSIGFGMTTKLSCALVAFVSGPIMIYHFVKAVKSKDNDAIKSIVKQLAVFAVICFPLGLWYAVRNYIAFDQPLNYVMKISDSSPLYTGDETFWSRWGLFSPLDFWQSPYSDPYSDANVWMGLLKTGMHGEFTWDNLSPFLARIADYAHLAVWIITAAAVIITMFKNKTIDKTQKFSAFWVWALFGLSVIQFNILYTFGCTVNFRYALIVQIAAVIFIGYLCEYLWKKKNLYAFYTLTTVLGIFCALCVLHFC